MQSFSPTFAKNVGVYYLGTLILGASSFDAVCTLSKTPLRSWRRLLIVHFDIDTFSGVFFTCLHVVQRGFCLHPVSGLLGLFVLLSSLINYFFSWTYQIVDLATSNVLASWHLFGLHIERSTEPFPNANSTIIIFSTPLIGLICQDKWGHYMNLVVSLLSNYFSACHF